jgi:hypothetical protein
VAAVASEVSVSPQAWTQAVNLVLSQTRPEPSAGGGAQHFGLSTKLLQETSRTPRRHAKPNRARRGERSIEDLVVR